jgi:hypothetical protein
MTQALANLWPVSINDIIQQFIRFTSNITVAADSMIMATGRLKRDQLRLKHILGF